MGILRDVDKLSSVRITEINKKSKTITMEHCEPQYPEYSEPLAAWILVDDITHTLIRRIPNPEFILGFPASLCHHFPYPKTHHIDTKAR